MGFEIRVCVCSRVVVTGVAGNYLCVLKRAPGYNGTNRRRSERAFKKRYKTPTREKRSLSSTTVPGLNVSPGRVVNRRPRDCLPQHFFGFSTIDVVTKKLNYRLETVDWSENFS